MATRQPTTKPASAGFLLPQWRLTMETVIAKTVAMILFFSSHQWGLFLPMLPEHNSMESCQESGKNMLKSTTDGSIAAFFCIPLTAEQIANLSQNYEHKHHEPEKNDAPL